VNGFPDGSMTASGLRSHSWIDLDRGVFYRRPAGRRETKKTTACDFPLPDQLLAHLRRWKQQGQRFEVEWNGQPVHSVDKAFVTVDDAGEAKCWSER